MERSRKTSSCGAAFGRRIVGSSLEGSEMLHDFLECDIEDILRELRASRVRILRRMARVESMMGRWRA